MSSNAEDGSFAGSTEMVSVVPAMSDGSAGDMDESLVPVEATDTDNPDSALVVISEDSLPDLSYQALYQQNQSHFETRLQFERLQTKRQTLLLKSLRNDKRLAKKVRDDARLLRTSHLAGPAIINTPFRASVGGRPSTMPGLGPSGKAVTPDYLNPKHQESQEGKVLAGIHKCLAHGVLILAGQQLEAVPRNIFNTFAVQTGCVRSVNLSKNCLTEVPREIKYFCNATHLNLSYNEIEDLPHEVGELKMLKVLRLQTNRLWRLPKTLFNCASLEILDCSNNALAELPGNMARNMSSLRELYLQSNRLVQLPGSFAHLTSLERLDINDNELMSLALCPVVQNIWDDEETLDEGILGNRDWMKFIHPETGAVSYYNSKTRESRRSKPAGFLDEDDSRWQKMMDSTTHETYWLNVDTNETSWETPAEILEQFKRDMKIGIKESAKPVAKKAEEEQLRMLARIEGSVWEVARDTDGVKDYFTNILTKETTWDMPADVDLWENLKNLQVIRVSRNRLASIPESITRLPELQDLDFSDNLVTALPRGFSGMPALKHINFSGNQVRFFPKSIDRLKDTLETLKANNNNLQRLHPSMGNLTKLRVLWVENNEIPTVPISFRNLSALVELNLESNPITVPTREVLLKGVEQIKWDCRRRFLTAKKGLPPKVGVKRYGVGNEVIAIDKRFEADQKKLLAVAKDGIQNINPWTKTAEAKGFMAPKKGDLNFHWRNVAQLPAEVWEMSHLENLRVVGSPLESLPELAFSTMSKLTVLQIRQTGLTQLPHSINSLVNLRECSFEDNALTSLPEDFGVSLGELTHLRLTNNKLTVLPPNFGEGMTKLRCLSLDINLLESIPETLGKASSLTFLTMTQNRLSALPDRLADLHALQQLYINQNQFKEIPAMVPKLHSLISFRAGQNKIGPLIPTEFCESPTLQRSLEQLWLYNNGIKELPPNFNKLAMLTDIKVDMNPMRSPPPEIVNEGVTAMVRYMHARAHRVALILAKLELFNFDFIQSHHRVGVEYNEDHLTPTVKDFLKLNGELKLLQPEDVKQVERAIDNFINSTFYRSNETLGSILKTLRKVLKERKTQRRSECLQAFVELLAYCNKHMVLDDHCFNANLVLKWGSDGLERKFYGVDLSSLYRANRKSIDHMIFLENDVPVYEFGYSYSDVADALKNYKGPFGNVGSDKWVVSFEKCGCDVEKQLELARHLKKLASIRSAESQLNEAIGAGAEDDVIDDLKNKIVDLKDEVATKVSEAIKNIKGDYEDYLSEMKSQAEADGVDPPAGDPSMLRQAVAELNKMLAEGGLSKHSLLSKSNTQESSVLTRTSTRASTASMPFTDADTSAGDSADDSFEVKVEAIDRDADEEDDDEIRELDASDDDNDHSGDASDSSEDMYNTAIAHKEIDSFADDTSEVQTEVSEGVYHDFPEKAPPVRRRTKSKRKRKDPQRRQSPARLNGISAQVTSKRELREMAIRKREQENEELILSLPIPLQSIPHSDGTCQTLAALCPQVIYTREEALRKAREDDEIRLYCDILTTKVKSWLASQQAKVRLNLSVKFNKKRARLRVKELRGEIKQLKKTAKQIKKQKENILLRKKMLEMGEPAEVHRFESMDEAMLATEVIAEEETKCEKQIKDAEEEIRQNNAKKGKSNAQLEVEIVNRVVEKYRSREEARLIEEFRWHAIENDLRRPWDGADGQKFLEWRLETVTKDPDDVDEEKENQLKAMRKGEFVFDSDNEDEDIGKQMVKAVGY